VAGDPEGSLLIQAIRHTHEDLKMPLNRRLPEKVVSAFAKWVGDGAIWPTDDSKPLGWKGAPSSRHWAFERVKVVEPPPDPTGWSDRPIDRFVASRRRAAGLRPSVADLALPPSRHVHLIGLPSTPGGRGFLGDTSPDAFSRVVDRLLASWHYLGDG
jgi:hypothetical protein